ncbi:MAG: hypothetical protein C5B47_01280 [Verrucomicrobia bacterium]|nr:MAG: hypothetical protein C5B47_01280 [Verrucomicrobiota bacterium]
MKRFRRESPFITKGFCKNFAKKCLCAALVNASVWIGSLSYAEDRIGEALIPRSQGFPQVTVTKLSDILNENTLNESDKLRTLRELGRTYFEAGQWAEAIAVLRPLSTDRVAGFWLAQAFVSQGEYAQALPLYQRARADETLRPYAILGEARMLHALKKYNAALALLSEIPPKSIVGDSVALERTSILLDLNRLAEASLILKANATLASSPWGRYFLARMAMLEKRWEDAAALLNHIHSDDSELIKNILLARVECFDQLGDFTSAENLLVTFIQEHPEHSALPVLFAKLDEVYDRENNPSGGDLRRWAEDANHPFRAGYAKFYRARNDSRIGLSDGALILFREFIRDLPQHPLVSAARAEIAEYYLHNSKAQDALDSLSTFRSHLPGAGDIASRINFLRGSALFALSRYAEAANAFLDASHQDPSSAAETALYNSALSYLFANSLSGGNLAKTELMKRYPTGEALRQLRFVEALQKAKWKHPDAAQALAEVAKSSVRAQLAFAEFCFAHKDFARASEEWMRFSDHPGAFNDRAAYLALSLADASTKVSEDQVIRLAQDFLEAYPSSSFKPEVRMKLGEIFFRRENFLAAQIQFETLAREFPDSPLTESALFFAGQSAVRSMEPTAAENAMLIFEKVAKMRGPFASLARLEQARVQEALVRPDQALLILKNILALQSDPEIRAEALTMQGNILFGQGPIGSENYVRAIESWQQILLDPRVTLPWKNQALTKIGTAYQKLEDTGRALASYYEVFSTFNPANPEFFWFYKAGFDAGKLLESQKKWNEAIRVYEQLAAIAGPRAQEAKQRIQLLKQQHLISTK